MNIRLNTLTSVVEGLIGIARTNQSRIKELETKLLVHRADKHDDIEDMTEDELVKLVGAR